MQPWTYILFVDIVHVALRRGCDVVGASVVEAIVFADVVDAVE